MIQLTQNQKLLLLVIIILLIYLIYKSYKKKHETFSLSELVSLDNGLYSIVNYNGVELISSAFTPVSCNNNLLQKDKQYLHPIQKGWQLKNISKGIYIFEKPNTVECMYTHSTMNQNDSIRSYISSNCNKRQLCGTDNIIEKQLDDENIRTYFRIIKSSINDYYYIISLKNNKYVCMDSNNNVTFSTSADKSNTNCLFKFTETRL